MSSKREAILAAIRTALTGTVGVGTRIYRSRVEPLARAEAPAIIIEPVDDQASIDTSLPTLTWRLTVRVTVLVRGSLPDQLADPIVVDLHSKLTADQTLGGNAMDIQPVSVSFNLEEADQAAGAIMCDYLVIYRTSYANLSNS